MESANVKIQNIFNGQNNIHVAQNVIQYSCNSVYTRNIFVAGIKL
jgi:hypothetical protein